MRLESWITSSPSISSGTRDCPVSSTTSGGGPRGERQALGAVLEAGPLQVARHRAAGAEVVGGGAAAVQHPARLLGGGLHQLKGSTLKAAPAPRSAASETTRPPRASSEPRRAW